MVIICIFVQLSTERRSREDHITALFDNCKARRKNKIKTFLFFLSLYVMSLSWDRRNWPQSCLEPAKYELELLLTLYFMSAEMINVKSLKTLARNEISFIPRRGKGKYKHKKLYVLRDRKMSGLIMLRWSFSLFSGGRSLTTKGLIQLIKFLIRASNGEFSRREIIRRI